LDSESSLYKLVHKRKDFIPLEFNILMEYAEGKTLREYMDSSDYQPVQEDIFKLIWQLMTALKHIHKHNLIHRDIKPENIFIDPRTKKLKVGDFGLAKSF